MNFSEVDNGVDNIDQQGPLIALPEEEINSSGIIRYVLPTSSPEMRTAIVFVYFLTFVLGSTGNGLVIYIIWRHSEIRVKSVANYYIWNLSMADFLFVCSLPFFCYATFTSDWPFGEVCCKLAYAVRETTKFASVFTLIALSVDRYVASFYNTGRFRSVLVGKLVCAAIWCCFIALAMPYLVYAETMPQPHTGGTSCRVKWPIYEHQTIFRAWTWTQFIVGFVLPFFAIVSAYTALGLRLKRLLNGGSKMAVKRPGIAMTRMILVITLTFLVTQLPYYVVEFLNIAKSDEIMHEAERRGSTVKVTHHENDSTTSMMMMTTTTTKPVYHVDYRLYVILNTIAKLLVFVSSCCNPIIYGLLNKNYRTLYREVFCQKCRPERVPDATGSSETGAPNTREGRLRPIGITCVTNAVEEEMEEITEPPMEATTEAVEIGDETETMEMTRMIQ